jgi:hypothetical protein
MSVCCVRINVSVLNIVTGKKGKRKFVPIYAVKMYRGSGGKVPLIRNHGFSNLALVVIYFVLPEYIFSTSSRTST